MPQIIPFKAVRYATTTPDISAFIAPPYDVISASQKKHLAELSPYNVSRLELTDAPENPNMADETYQNSKKLWLSLLEERVLTADDEPALYLIKQTFTNPLLSQVAPGENRVTRTAVFCGVELADWKEGKVLPHEATLPKALGDRFALIEATNANYSPIFGMYDANEATNTAYDKIEHFTKDAAPCATATELDGTQTKLWKIPASCEAAQSFISALKDQTIVIADGHHRYTVALAHKQAERDRMKPQITKDILPSDFIMMGIVKMDDPGLIVLPYHRIIKTCSHTDFKRDQFLNDLKTDFDIQPYSGKIADLSGHLDSYDLPTFGIVIPAHDPVQPEIYIATLKPQSALDAYERINNGCSKHERSHQTAIEAQTDDLSQNLDKTVAQSMKKSLSTGHTEQYCLLDTVVLQHYILGSHFGVDLTDKKSLEQLSFTHELTEALHPEHEDNDLSIIVRSLPVSKIMDVSQSGDVTPQKTTYFYPKFPSGFVMRDLRKEME